MNFTITFIGLYIVSMIIGKKFIKTMPSIAIDSIVLTIIFTIAFWGGVEVSSQAVKEIIIFSLIASIVVVTVAYFLWLSLTLR